MTWPTTLRPRATLTAETLRRNAAAGAGERRERVLPWVARVREHPPPRARLAPPPRPFDDLVRAGSLVGRLLSSELPEREAAQPGVGIEGSPPGRALVPSWAWCV